MVNEHALISRVTEVASNTFLLEFVSSNIASSASPGQFVNIKVDRSDDPLLRRPMSISDVEGETVKVLFNIVGKGTSILARKVAGDNLDVLGPAGRGFDTSREYDLAVVVAGGLGVAPFPFLTRALSASKKKILTFVGCQSADQLSLSGLQNINVATDDGSRGFKGTVVGLLRSKLSDLSKSKTQVFCCGPTAMLRALQELLREFGLVGQVSVETRMACGIGLCQGCAVGMSDGSKKYKLSCKDGPVFDLSKIVI